MRKGLFLTEVDFEEVLLLQSQMLRVYSSFEVELWTNWVLILFVLEGLVTMTLSCLKHSVGQTCLVIIILVQVKFNSN